MFSVRIVTTDHYQSTPIPGLDVEHSDFRATDVWKVPVVRIYGSTPGGQKTCMHVHGVFPYLYVPYDGTQPWDRYLRLFANSLDKALNVSLNRANANTQHVYKINLVSGIPMYGYHDKEEQFLKIFLFNPSMVKKAADLLLGGAVMNKAFQPHESHIPYVLQMFIDYNLYGMNLVNVAAVKFRRQNKDDNGNPVEHEGNDNDNTSSQGSNQLSPQTPTALFDRSVMATPSRQTWDMKNLSEDLYLDECVTRQSTCELECDIVAPDILNRLDVDANVGTNPGLAALWEDERQRKRNLGESSQITPPDSQEREGVEISESDEMFRLKFLQIIQNHQPYMDSQTDEDSQDESLPDTTPASALDLQLSQNDMSDASQVTALVEDEDDEVKPIISVDSIKRVVSMSQSFSGSQGSQPQVDSQDKSLAEILASLANEGSPSSSQEVSQQIIALEEKDSILLDKSEPVNDEIAKQLDEETLEMSQVVWENNEPQDDEKPGPSSAYFDIEGLDDSWNVSQFLRKEKDESDEDDDVIPQFDGAIDEKPDKSGEDAQKKKRLGVSGPVISNHGQGYHGNTSYNQGNQFQQQDFNNQYMYQNWQQPSHMIPQTYGHDNQSHQSMHQFNDLGKGQMETSNSDARVNHGNSMNMPSPQYTGQPQSGFVNSYGNLKSPCHYPSPQSNYGNSNLHGSYSSLSSTSPRSNIQSPHDSNHGNLHSPALSSHSNMQSPSQCSSQGNAEYNHGTIKSPVSEDSRDSVYSSKNVTLPTSQTGAHTQKGSHLQKSQNLKSPQRMTPSPDLHDDFTVHHFSRSNSESNQRQAWSSQQSRSHVPQSPGYQRDMQSTQISSQPSQHFQQMSQQTFQQPFNSELNKAQYQGHGQPYNSYPQQMMYNNQAAQSSYNEIPFQQTMHNRNQSGPQNSLSRNMQPKQFIPSTQTNAQSFSPTAQPRMQFVQHFTLPKQVDSNPDNQKQSPASLSAQTNSSSSEESMTQLSQPYSETAVKQQASFTKPYPSTGQTVSQTSHSYTSPRSEQSQTSPTVTMHNLQTEDNEENSQADRNQTEFGSKLDNQPVKDQEDMNPFPHQSFQQLLSEDQNYSQMQSFQTANNQRMQSQFHPNQSSMNQFRFQNPHQGQYRMNEQGQLGFQGQQQYNGLYPQQDGPGYFPSQQFPGADPRMQIRAKVSRRGRRPKNMGDSNPLMTQQSFPGQLENQGMQMPVKAKRGRRPKNPQMNDPMLQQQFLMGLNGNQNTFPGQLGNPGMPMNVPAKAKRGRRPKSMTEPGQPKKTAKKQDALNSFMSQNETCLTLSSDPNEMVTLNQPKEFKHQDPSVINPNLQRIPSVVSVMNDNKTFQTDSKKESSSSNSVAREPTTLERLLLYGDEGEDKSSQDKKSTEKGNEQVKHSKDLVDKYEQSEKPLSQTLSPNGSVDLFSDSSQSSISSKPLKSASSIENCDMSFSVKNNSQDKESLDKTSDRSSLFSLANFVGSVSPASSYGYQYNKPMRGGDTSVFASPEPYMQQPSNSSQCYTPFGNKSPSFQSMANRPTNHVGTPHKSPSNSGTERHFFSPPGSGGSKSPSHMTFHSQSNPIFNRSMSYDGSQVYHCENSSSRDIEMCSQDNNPAYTQLNNSWSSSSTNNQTPNHQHPTFQRSQSFSFDKKGKGHQSKTPQQTRCRADSVSKKPPPPPNAAYTFTFHVPTPVYKQLKFTHHKRPKSDDIKIVRMHPMDARRYSLLKIGRGIVKAKQLTQADVDKAGVVLKGPLNELLTAAKNAKQRKVVQRSLSYNSAMKAPYDIKTENVVLNSGTPNTNTNNSYFPTGNMGEVNGKYNHMSNTYPQKMIVPEPQTLADSSEDCYNIRKVTLTSIIENVLINSMKEDSETNKGNEHENKESGSQLSSLLTGGSDRASQDSQTVIQNGPMFNNHGLLSTNNVINTGNSHNSMTHAYQGQPVRNTSSLVMQNQLSGSFVNVMFPNNPVGNISTTSTCQNQNIENGGHGNMVNNQILDGCTSKPLVGIPNSSGQVCKKIEKQPRRKNLMLCRKRSMNKMLTSSPSVIDPDIDDQDVILRDVSLIEASEGTLTPIKSRTPVAGRSPIRQQGSDSYKLFDGELLNLKDDIENKLKYLDSGMNTKIFPNISDRESSSSTDTAITSTGSSRASSRINSSESLNNLPLVSKESEKSCVLHGQHTSEENVEWVENTSQSVPKIVITEPLEVKNESRNNLKDVECSEDDSHRKRKAVCLMLDSNSDINDLGDEQKKKMYEKWKEKENIDTCRNGKFKGCKQMVVSLSKVDQDKNSQSDNLSNAQTKLTVSYGRTKWTKVKSQENLYSDISSESSQDIPSGEHQSTFIKPSSLIELSTSENTNGYFKGLRKSLANEQNEAKQKKKSSLSINRKLQVAFLSKKRKQRPRKTPKITGKWKLKKGLNSIKGLSLLHEATLASLTEPSNNTTETKSQTDNGHSDSSEDYIDNYEDVLQKLALYSSPESDSLDSIPPEPFSPEELSQDRQGLTRSTSDAQSPAFESESSTSSTDSKHLHVYPNNYPKLIIGKENFDCKTKVVENKLSNISSHKRNDSESSDSIASCNEKKYSVSEKQLNKKAFVKLRRLSDKEIDQYGAKIGKKGRTGGQSPPDLGPPYIPKYPTGNSTDNSESPPKLSDQELESDNNSLDNENSPVYEKMELDSKLSENGKSPVFEILETNYKSTDKCKQIITNGSNESMDLTSKFNTGENRNIDVKNVSGNMSFNSSNSDNPLEITSEKFENRVLTSGYPTNSYISIEGKSSLSLLQTNSPAPFDNSDVINTTKNIEDRNQQNIIKPKLLPPSLNHVTETALSHGLNLANNQAAFCSNPDDVPDKPRETGGRILKIESCRVSDLTEFSSNTENDGLSTWRQVLCAGNQLFDGDNLSEKLEQEPQLRFALMGDKSIIITPCNPAPTCKKVTDWMVGREKYKKLQANKKRSCESTIKEKGDKDDKKSETVEIINCDQKLQREKTNCIVKTVSFCESCDKRLSFSACDDNILVNKNGTKSDEGCIPVVDCHSPNENKHVDQQDIGPVKEISHKRPVLGEIDDNTDEDDVIGPSPPNPTPPSSQLSRNFNDRPIKKLRLFSSQSKFQFSPIIASQRPCAASSSQTFMSSQRSQIGILPNLHSTPVSRNKHSFILPACTPIDHLASQREISGTPRRTPLSKRTSIGAGKDLRTSLTSQLQQYATPDQKGNISQIDGPTPKNSFGFQVSQQNIQDTKALHEVQNLTTLSMELLAETRGDHLPDPEIDPVQAVFYSILNDVHSDKGPREIKGVIMVDCNSKKLQSEQERRRENKEDKSISMQSSTPVSPKPSTSKDTRYSTAVKSSTPDSPQPSTSKDYGLKVTSPSRSKSPKPVDSSSKNTSSSPGTNDLGKDIGQTILQKSGIDGKLTITYVESEADLFQSFIDLILRWDPDILVGYEIQKVSWGYLLQRAAQIGINLCSKISRIPDDKRGSHFSAQKDEYGADHMSEIHIVGRIVINLWRIMRHEVTLNIYTFENVMYHVLHQRVPHYSFKSLNSWYNHRTHLYRWRVINYFTSRVEANLQLIDQVDLIGRTSEFARVFGIEFYHVLSRGSQFRVESMMLRLAKPMNFIPVSPNVQQRARMRAAECIPLTLEPESRFYHDPVVVVDFQSLYPSIMIAYNYCFSTCLGRIDLLERAHEGSIEFGCTHLKIPPSVLKKIKDDITVSPNGIVFVKQHVRKGIISAMVEEILNTRIMVKKGMKDYKNDKTLHRLLDARQLGLKLIANVTYGYTGACFSGRMPCVEVADSIVRKARETLERSIKLVEDTPKWGARVVYGDTDSMFILLKGRSKEDAFKIGYEICDAVTAMHPSPIKLKFEKVYLPCVLQTKKRYVGFSYETPDQKEPIFDAKGIETVRRDSCPAVSKILERSIKVLFTTKDISQVKQYVQNQCCKVMEGKVGMLDLIFAKEYRGMPGYKPGACVPALEIARKSLRSDRRSEPCVGERVPYVIVYGSPGLPLIQLVKQPHELLADPSLRINATYYITKQILPPLGRMLSLLGVDVFSWYNDMPKIVRVVPQSLMSAENKKGTISQYFASSNCPVCDKPTNQNICNNCIKDPQTVAITLNDRIRKWETVYCRLEEICNSCMGTQDEQQPCKSLNCPILYRRNLAAQDNQKGKQLREVLEKVLDF